MTFYNVSLPPPPPIFSIKTHNSMHRLNINCSAGGVPPPPPPPPLSHMAEAFRLHLAVYVPVSDFECIWREQNKAWKGDRLLSRINTYKTIDPIRQQLRSPYTHHPPPPPHKKDEIINMAYCTCACACAYGYLNWGVIWRGVYTVSCHRTSNRVLFLDRYKT